MASSKKKREIRQAPKHLDKMLFINYKEEERLQQRLNELSDSSRLRGIELDRQKVQVHREMRLNKRRNSVPSPATAVISRPTTRDSRPASREASGAPPGFRRRGSAAGNGDSVNEYLLTEFRRVSEVIPAILSSLNKEETKEGEEDGQGRPGGQERNRGREMSARSRVSTVTTPFARLDPDLKAFVSKETVGSGQEPNIHHMVSTIRSIRALREDLQLKKRYDLTRARTSFPDLLRNIQEEERRRSDSDTYTDGACVLLRRKMHKARRASCPAIEFSSVQGSQGSGATQPASGSSTPPRRISRSNTSLTSVDRHSSRDGEGLRAMLKEEDRQNTEIKVATEQRRFDDIRMRIGHFLNHVKGPAARRCSLPVLTGAGEVIREEV